MSRIKPITVFIADDHADSRTGLKDLLETDSNIRVVGEAPVGPEAVALTHKLHPDLALVDFRCPISSAIECVRELRRKSPSTNILILTSFPEDVPGIDILQAGANGHLSKTLSSVELIKALKGFCETGGTLPQATTRESNENLGKGEPKTMSDATIDLLTDTERSVLSQMCGGQSQQEIAESFGLEFPHISKHVDSIIRKLGVESQVEAIIRGIEFGLATPGETAQKDASATPPAQARSTHISSVNTPQDQAPDSQEAPRHPNARFFYFADGEFDPIPDDHTVAPAPSGAQLEFHFWLDPEQVGIAHRELTDLAPPQGVSFPIRLRVDVESLGGFVFPGETHAELELGQKGPSNVARFVVIPDPSKGTGIIRIFVRFNEDIVSVHRASATLSKTSRATDATQGFDNDYLAGDWFCTAGQSRRTSLCIYFDKSPEGVVIGSLFPGEPPIHVGTTREDFYSQVKDIYFFLHRVAQGEAAASSSKGSIVPLQRDDALDALSKHGWKLFTNTFANGTGESRQKMLKLLGSLKEGDRVNVAVGKQAAPLPIPWNFIYDRNPDLPYGERIDPSRFWGLRYQICLRPSLQVPSPTPLDERPANIEKKLRITALWKSSKAREVGASALKTIATSRPRSSIRQVTVSNGLIPGLFDEPCDMVHLFCHGHTALTGTPLQPQEISQHFLKQGNSLSAAHQDRRILQELQAGKPDRTNLDADGGTAYLDTLRAEAATKNLHLKGEPIVLLSMCESAQVSCSGEGFVRFFLDLGAKAVIGTEGSPRWTLGAKMDEAVIRRLLEGDTVGEALYCARRQLFKEDILAVIYTLIGDSSARISAGALEGNHHEQ